MPNRTFINATVQYHDTLIASRFVRYYKRSFLKIKNEIIETDPDGKEHYRLRKDKCPGLDDLLEVNDFITGRARIERITAEDDTVCSLCGHKIRQGETVVTLNAYGKESTVHDNCSENVFQLLENLTVYPGPFPGQKKKWQEIIDDPAKAEKDRRPPVKASWKYYPLYKYFCGQKKKLIRMTVEDLEDILGFRLKEELREYNRLKANKGKMLQLRDAWELAGYTVKPVKRFTGKITFERKEPSLKPVLNHPLMECEVTAQVQRDVNNCILALIKSKR